MPRNAKKADSVRQSRFLSLVTYLSESQLIEVLTKKQEQISGCAYIHHEPDSDDGVNHTHVQLVLRRSRDPNVIRNWFKGYKDEKGLDINTKWEYTHSISGIHDYFMHIDEDSVQKKKKQYTDEDIKVLNGIDSPWDYQTDEEVAKARAEYNAVVKQEKAEECDRLIDDIIDGVPKREMARKYGRDYMKNFKAYSDFASMVVLEETQDLEKARMLSGCAQGLVNHVANEAYNSAVVSMARGISIVFENTDTINKTDLFAYLGGTYNGEKN